MSTLEVTNQFEHGIRHCIDFQSLIRRCLVVGPLPPGCIPEYETEPESENIPKFVPISVGYDLSKPTKERVMYYYERGWDSRQLVTLIDKPDANVRLNIEEVEFSVGVAQNFNFLQAEQDKKALVDNIIHYETEILYEMCLVSANLMRQHNWSEIEGNDFTSTVEQAFRKAKTSVDQWDYVATTFIMNDSDFNSIAYSRLPNMDLSYPHYPGCAKAHIYGASCYTTPIVPQGTIISLAEPEFIGVAAIKQDIYVKSISNNILTVGLAAGYSIINHKAIGLCTFKAEK